MSTDEIAHDARETMKALRRRASAEGNGSQLQTLLRDAANAIERLMKERADLERERQDRRLRH